MNEKIYQEIPEHLRENELRAQCTKVEEGKYKKYFTDEERAEKNKEYVKDSGELFRLVAEYKEKIKSLNSEIKLKREELNKKLQIVDNGFINVEGKLFLFDDQETGYMSSYDATGILVEKRKLLPEEREYLSFRKISGE